MRKPKVVLKNWSVIAHGERDPYQPPEAMRQCLAGDVIGHPCFDDGHFVTTSPIVGAGTLDEHGYSPSYLLEGVVPLDIRDGMIVQTANTLYMLDGVCPKYKAWCDTNAYSVST